MQVLVAVAGLPEAGEFRGRHQVVLEILELTTQMSPERSVFFISDNAHSS